MKARFQIRNVIDAVPALPLAFTFSQRGGTIGSGEDATWRIQDADKTIAEIAARVVVIDDHFTLTPLSGQPIRINGGRAPMSAGRPVILTDKDTLRIGTLDCSVAIGPDIAAEVAVTSLAAVAPRSARRESALLIEGEFTPVRDALAVTGPQVPADPIAVIERQSASVTGIDPILALETDRRRQTSRQEQDLCHELEGRFVAAETASSAEAKTSPTAAHLARDVHRDRYGFEELAMGSAVDTPHPDRAGIELDHPVDHVALLPLTRALGLPLGNMTAEEANDTLAEIGGALRAAIDGLVSLHQTRQSAGRRIPFAALHMHALEDNPLRFARDTDEALHALFAKRGAVHQAAPVAMAEMMAHLDMHQSATETAIDAALESVLGSIMPGALERRFRSYAPDDYPDAGPAREAWCWRMFSAYFAELRANRQRGLQMLFWEVFQHEFQSVVRARRAADITGGDIA